MTLIDSIAQEMVRREREDGLVPFHIDYYRYLAEAAIEAYERYAMQAPEC